MANDARQRSPWSVSLHDATPHSAPNEVNVSAQSAGYSCGNNDSTTFFRMMNASHGEAERLRQQCRAAASVSAARNQEEKVYLGHFHKNIDSARAVANFAKTAEHTDLNGTVLDRVPNAVPACLGHLSKPKPKDDFNSTNQSSLCFGRDVTRDIATDAVQLPGAVDSFEEVPFDLPADTELQPGAKALSLGATPRSPPDTGTSRQQQAPAGISDGLEVDTGFEEDLVSSEVHSTKNVIDPMVPHQTQHQDGEEDESSWNASSDDDATESSDRWPPKPPLGRFKIRVQFSNRFKPSKNKVVFEKLNEDQDLCCEKTVEPVETETKTQEMQDMIVGWINLYFAFKIKTENEFEIVFPLIVLTMLDAIYPKRVRWREVDWRFQHKRALTRNHATLHAIWMEVNMEKAREFRCENTSLRCENMLTASLKEKLDFLRLMKRWFEQRISSAGAYDALQKRREYVAQCKCWGYTVKFPPWILYDKEEPEKAPPRGSIAKLQDFSKMPEYKRLILFLGSGEHQTM